MRRRALPLAIVAGLFAGGIPSWGAVGSTSVQVARFRTVAGVVTCGATFFPGQGRFLRCNGPLVPPPPRPSSCHFDWGIGMQMTATGESGPVCASDPGFNPVGAPVLPYGASWRHYRFVCTATPAGVTCRNVSGHGWFMSAHSWRRF